MNIYLKTAQDYAKQADIYFRAIARGGHDDAKFINGMACLSRAEYYFEMYKSQALLEKAA